MELEYYHDAPNELISPSELIRQQQDILARNGENQRKRMRAAELESQKQALRRQLDEIQSRYDAACRDCDIAARDAAELLDESTEELEQNIRDIEAINQKVRVNLEKERAEDDASTMKKQYEDLTDEIETVRKQKLDLLNGRESAASRSVGRRRRAYIQRIPVGQPVRERPAPRGRRNRPPSEPAVRFCADGQAGTDGH